MGESRISAVDARRTSELRRNFRRETSASGCVGWRGRVALAFILCPLTSFSQKAEPSATLSGTVRDRSGRGVVDAAVELSCGKPAQTFSARTNADGKYHFSGLRDGVCVLTASTNGPDQARIPSLFLGPHESKTVDVTLGPAQAFANSSMSPQFSDEPRFAVAGVTDTTSLGGHGSDTIARARDSLAKDAGTLGSGAESRDASTGDMAASARSLRDRVEHEPSNAELHHRLANLEEKLDDPLEAVREYQRAAELNPSEAYVFDWGSELLLHHAPEPAIEVFSRGNHLFPRSARMLIGLGAAQFARGLNEDAVREICAASDLEPDDPGPYLFMGKIERAVNISSAQVVERLHRFVTLHPQNAEANYYYAVALWKHEKNSAERAHAAEIESLLMRSVQIDPKFGAAYLQLGIVRAERGDHREAIAALERAIEAESKLEEAHYRLALEYRQVDEAEKAKKELQIYGELDKQSTAEAERERHEIRQFVYTLRDRPAAENR